MTAGDLPACPSVWVVFYALHDLVLSWICWIWAISTLWWIAIEVFGCLLLAAFVAYFNFLMVLISGFVAHVNKRSW